MLLSDLGADVVRIDRKDRGRASPTDVTSRGRRSIGMDLKSPDAIEACLKLIESADAVFEGFRPGVMERLGLGPDVALKRNPKLVYGRMTGWGQTGPYAHAAGHDMNYIAITGALEAIGTRDKPVPPLNLVGDFGGGALYLAFVAPRLLPAHDDEPEAAQKLTEIAPPFRPWAGLASVAIFAFVLGAAAGGLPIAVTAFVGAMALLLFRLLTPEDAYAGLRPQVLLMIGGMLVVGEALGKTGLAFSGTNIVASLVQPLGPVAALAVIYVATSVLTEIMSNAAVAVLITPLAIGLAENLGVAPRPFVVAVMMAASASFATPVGYQSNAIVHQVGGYAYMDFVRVGLPLNILSAIVAIWMIPKFFPF